MAFDRCKLCLKNKLLIKQSHIIPNFMYKGLFDESNIMIFASLVNRSRPVQKVQTGYFDKFILCYDCEKKNFGELDSYASTVIYGNERHSSISGEVVKFDGFSAVRFNNIDVSKFKLFFLSLLWRANVSSKPFFQNVNLDLKDAEILRKILIGELLTDLSYYSISVFALVGADRKLIQFVSEPFSYSGEQEDFAVFLINGFAYIINFGNNKFLEKYEGLVLTDSGELTLPILANDLAHKFLEAMNFPNSFVKYFTGR